MTRSGHSSIPYIFVLSDQIGNLNTWSVTMKKFKTISALLAVSTMVFVIGAAEASYIFSFEKLSGNSPDDYSDQFSVVLDKTSTGDALFTVNNDATNRSSITGIYFEYRTGDIDTNIYMNGPDGGPVQETLIDTRSGSSDTSGINFLYPGSPDSLPGGKDIFGKPADFGGHTNGAGDGLNYSWEEISYLALLRGLTFDDLITQYVETGLLRIGLHVQQISDLDYSDAYVNKIPNVVPVPAAAWLFGTALFGFFATSRRKNIL